MDGENLEGVVATAQDQTGETFQLEPEAPSPEMVQQLTELKKRVDAEVERVRKETESRLQSVKDREVGKVIREKREIDADLKATQAGLGFMVDQIARGMEPEEYAKFTAGLQASVAQARAVAGALPQQEQSRVFEAQLKAVELAKAGIKCDLQNIAGSDPRLDFTYPSTFIASADALLAGQGKPQVSPQVQEPKPPVQSVQPPDIDESGRKSSARMVSKEKLDEQYADGIIGRADYTKKCKDLGYEL